MKEYYPRLIESKIERKLKSSGAVLITGPKYCGKTTTSFKFQKSNISLSDDNIIQIVKSDPKIALKGEFPRLIDEWQNIPNLWNLIRVEIDKNSSFGEYILTGSSTPLESDKIYHSGAGRITSIKMRTMSLYESKDSKGLVSLNELFNNKDYYIFDLNEDFSLLDVAYLICRGGWPQSIINDKEIALEITSNYYDGLFNFIDSENKELKNKRPALFKEILKSYARNISSQASYQTMINDIREKNISLDDKTFMSYLDIAKKLFIIEDIDAWSPSLRSKTVIRTNSTRHFLDTSIAIKSLGITPNDLLKDFNTFGLFFEDMAIRDLKIYADTLNGEVRHYRDKNNLEVDAIIRLDNGKWGAIEIKLGSEEGIKEGIKNLNKLESLLENNENKPSFKMVLTAVGKAYKINDVFVCPINLLKN